jgi:DNA-directed RNA polymerase subunit H
MSSKRAHFTVVKKNKKEEVLEEVKVTDHVLVPKHEILSPEEKKEVLGMFNATEEQSPFLFNIDPVAREIGAKPGDMVRITRVSDTAGETTYYRFVVESV